MNKLEEITKRYLLGELSEQEQDSLEERYFRDPKLFNAVLQVESQVVDAYARGQLSTDMRERFEKSYLNHPARRKRVNFAKALTTRIDQREHSVTRVEQSARSAPERNQTSSPTKLFPIHSRRLRTSQGVISWLHFHSPCSTNALQ